MRFLVRLIINAMALWLAAELVPRLVFDGGLFELALVAFLFGLVNAIIRPVVRLLTLPVTLMTFGLFGALGGAAHTNPAGGDPSFIQNAGFVWVPILVVLGIAALRRSATGRITGITIAVIGLAVSVWHNIIETFPTLDAGGCEVDNPCTLRWVEGLGFWTIPRMAAASFILIIALTTIDHFNQRPAKD